MARVNVGSLYQDYLGNEALVAAGSQIDS
ncbi:hypothetical protein V8G57_10825 [Collimonas sp. H4R21]|uniref:Uncharacterized protein n=1 Tax=Collimonas rhizosphaerae TaxID=3126357 RepID=A0ABU9PV67_9BURK